MKEFSYEDTNGNCLYISQLDNQNFIALAGEDTHRPSCQSYIEIDMSVAAMIILRDDLNARINQALSEEISLEGTIKLT